MQILRDMEVGVMFWAGGDPARTLREIKALGIHCGQMGVPGDLDLKAAVPAWKKALESEQFTLVTVFAAFTGESYADISTVKNTVGFVPSGTRAERGARMIEVSDFAAQLGVPGVATHIGAISDDNSDPEYLGVRELVRRICDRAAKHNQTFALETGQERANVLLDFFIDVNRDNLRINFDPANMILYGTGDPIEALGVLGGHVVSVHCKDGDWPPKFKPGALGEEKPLGKGAVGVERFIRKLKDIGYKGPLVIEREIPDAEQRSRDILAAANLLRSLAG